MKEVREKKMFSIFKQIISLLSKKACIGFLQQKQNGHSELF